MWGIVSVATSIHSVTFTVAFDWASCSSLIVSSHDETRRSAAGEPHACAPLLGALLGGALPGLGGGTGGAPAAMGVGVVDGCGARSASLAGAKSRRVSSHRGWKVLSITAVRASSTTSPAPLSALTIRYGSEPFALAFLFL